MHKQKPLHPGILLFLGNIYTKMGRYNQAIQAYQESLELDDRNPEALNNIGIVYRLEDNLPAAVGALERAKELAPERADIWYNLANVYKQMDEPEEAETYYRKAIEIAPAFSRAYNNLGNLYENRGDHWAAEELYNHGLRQDPNNPTLRYNLGISYQAEERIPEAIESYRQALKARPNWVDGMNNLGILLEKTGKYDEAARVLGNALELDAENPKLNNNYAVVLSVQGRHSEALDYLNRAVAKDPSYSRASINLGTELEELEEYDKAWAHLQTMKQKAPSDLDVREKIARLAVKIGKVHQAKEEIRFILDHNPKAGFAYALLGNLYLTRDDRKRAVQAFNRALTLSPEDLETTLNLALLYKEMKEYKQAISQVSGILARDPKHQAARLLLAKLYLYENLYSEALAILNGLYEESPHDEELLETLIRAHRGAGNREEALRVTETLVNMQGERDATLDLDKLQQTLHLYEETVEAFAEEHEKLWEENLKRYLDQDEGEVEPELLREEESLFFDTIPDLDQPAQLIDVGGIEPVIVINEDEERLNLIEMEEEIPEFPLEEQEEEEPEEKQIAGNTTPAPFQSVPTGPPAPSAENHSSDTAQQNTNTHEPERPINITFQGWPPASNKIELGGSVDLGQLRLSVNRPRKKKKTKPDVPVQTDKQKEEEESPAELLSHLENLTRYLPDERRSEYVNSDMRLRLEALRDRLAGRPSLRQQVSRYMPPSDQKEEKLVLKPGKIESTLSFMGELSTYLPNPEIGVALHHRISEILKTMKRDEHGES
jgi:tetratricopeptide (TPR) repeat protein